MAGAAKEERIEVRLGAAEKKRFKLAADLLDLNLSEFVLTSAREAAAHAMASQTRFLLPAKQMEDFYEALDQPPRTVAKLKALFRRPSPFDGK